MLGAFCNTGTALDAIACESSLANHGSRCRDVLMHALVPTVSKRCVVGGETHWDVHPFWARQAVSASCAGDLVALRDMLTRESYRRYLGIFERSGKRCVGCLDVPQQLLLRVHSRQHHGNLGMIPYPAKRQPYRVVADTGVGKRDARFLRKIACKLATKKGLHDDDG